MSHGKGVWHRNAIFMESLMREHIQCTVNTAIILMKLFSKKREKYGNIIYSSLSDMPLGTISWAIHSF